MFTAGERVYFYSPKGMKFTASVLKHKAGGDTIPVQLLYGDNTPIENYVVRLIPPEMLYPKKVLDKTCP